MSHIHLLSDDFRDDKCPSKLVNNALELSAMTSQWRYQGALPEEKVHRTDYTMKDLFGRDFSQRLDKYENIYHTGSGYKCFEYPNKEEGDQGKELGFESELKMFKKINYDNS